MTHCSLHPTRRGRRAAPTLLALAAALALSAPGPALATDYTWVGGAQPLPTNWSFAANWANSLRAVSADDTVLRFPNSFAAASNDISVGFRLNALRAFENGQPGGGTMGGLALALSGTAPEILVGALGTLNLNAPLTGARSIGKRPAPATWCWVRATAAWRAAWWWRAGNCTRPTRRA
jgi:hypothetical protein